MIWANNLYRFVCNEGKTWKAISKTAVLFLLSLFIYFEGERERERGRE